MHLSWTPRCLKRLSKLASVQRTINAAKAKAIGAPAPSVASRSAWDLVGELFRLRARRPASSTAALSSAPDHDRAKKHARVLPKTLVTECGNATLKPHGLDLAGLNACLAARCLTPKPLQPAVNTPLISSDDRVPLTRALPTLYFLPRPT